MWDYVVLASAWSLRESWRRRGAQSRVEERKQGRGEDRRGESKRVMVEERSRKESRGEEAEERRG